MKRSVLLYTVRQVYESSGPTDPVVFLHADAIFPCSAWKERACRQEGMEVDGLAPPICGGFTDIPYPVRIDRHLSDGSVCS